MSNMNLYALSLNGNMLFFCGKIDEDAYTKINSLIRELNVEPMDDECENFCKTFTSLVKSKLNYDLKNLKIEYVFRK